MPIFLCSALPCCVVPRLLELVTESLALPDAAFQHTLPTIISWLHTQRKACGNSTTNACGASSACGNSSASGSGDRHVHLKSWYSRLLFLLSRCSRLLTTGDDAASDGVSSSSGMFVSTCADDSACGGGALNPKGQGAAGLGSSTQQGNGSATGTSRVSPKVLQLLWKGALAAAGRGLLGTKDSSSGSSGSGHDSSTSACTAAAAAAGTVGGGGAGDARAEGSSRAGSRGQRARRRSALGKQVLIALIRLTHL